MKKKLFVLYQDDGKRGARLEYFDSEKKYKNGAGVPKRSIVLKECLSINTKLDAKHKHAIALYTKEDCFAMVCENDAEQREWMKALEELQRQFHEPAAEGESPRSNFGERLKHLFSCDSRYLLLVFLLLHLNIALSTS